MRLADYQSILEGTADHVDLSRDALLTTHFRQIRTFHRKRLRQIWEAWKWTELDLTEKRYFAQRWDDALEFTLAALEFVYHEPTKSYFQRINPSAWSEPSTGGTIDKSVWAEAVLEPAPDDYSATLTYNTGDQVAFEGALYQCISDSTGPGTDPTNIARWREFTAWIPKVAKEQSWETNKIGDVWCIHDRDPRATTQAEEVSYKMYADEAVILTSDVTFVWVTFRQQAPTLFGEVFNPAQNYVVGDQVYYSGTTRGDFYECIATFTAADVDISSNASWSKVEIPLIFAEYLMLAGAADWEKSKRHMDIAAYHSNAAQAEMERVQSIELSFEGQLPRTRVNRSQVLWD